MFDVLKRLFKFFFKGVGCLFMIIGFFAFLLVVALISLIVNITNSDFAKDTFSMPDSYSLVLNVDEIYDVKANEDFFTAFSTAGMGVSRQDVLKALKIAADDDRVKGLYAKMNDNWLGLSDTRDLCKVVSSFKQKGKSAEIYSEVIGLSGTGAASYYLASSFDKIWLQPTGDVNFVGVSLFSPFFKGLLNKLGIKNEIYALYEYKSGAESYTEEKMSEPVKKNMNSILDSVYAELIKDVSEARGISVQQMTGFVNRSPMPAEEAKAANLVDNLGYFDDFILDRGDTVSIKSYITNLKATGKWDKTIDENTVKVAVININGMIVSGSQFSSLFPEDIAAADDIAKALREAADDESVRAIVLNINSGGGSYTASDVIRHTVEDIKQKKKKPVVALLGSTAASGAYFVASAADRIIASPFTITGSVGVFGGKPVIGGLMQKLGVNVEIISKGDNAAIMGITEPFTPKQKQMFERSLQTVYADFTNKVAKSRGFTKEQTDKIARGRIFTGLQAVENGLVDSIGSWDEVLDYIADVTKTDKNDLVGVMFPKPKSNMDLLMDFLGSADLSTPSVMLNAFIRQVSVMSNANLMYDEWYVVK